MRLLNGPAIWGMRGEEENCRTLAATSCGIGISGVGRRWFLGKAAPGLWLGISPPIIRAPSSFVSPAACSAGRRLPAACHTTTTPRLELPDGIAFCRASSRAVGQSQPFEAGSEAAFPRDDQPLASRVKPQLLYISRVGTMALRRMAEALRIEFVDSEATRDLGTGGRQRLRPRLTRRPIAASWEGLPVLAPLAMGMEGSYVKELASDGGGESQSSRKHTEWRDRNQFGRCIREGSRLGRSCSGAVV